MRKAGEVSYADVRRDRDGEGIVEFSSYDSMKNALKELDGVDLKGSRVTVRERRSTVRSRSRSRTPPRNRYRSRSPRDRRRDEKSSSKDTRRRRSDSQEDDRRSSRRDRDSTSRRSERRDSEERD
ncbi:hypothetical protein BC943DRAFT_332768 [Umbelopsis sp. AD052]|nr:hypothetical protein BC943DRAFT_332768 [Umbelopsis sp. AD052]